MTLINPAAGPSANPLLNGTKDEEQGRRLAALHKREKRPAWGERKEEAKWNQVQRLLSRHMKILELSLAGHSEKEIAQVLEMHPRSIKFVTTSPLFQDQLARRRREVEQVDTEEIQTKIMRAREKDASNAINAADVQGNLLDSQNEDIQYKTSKSILDRVFRDTSIPLSSRRDQPITINAESMQVLALAINESKEYRDG